MKSPLQGTQSTVSKAVQVTSAALPQLRLPLLLKRCPPDTSHSAIHTWSVSVPTPRPFLTPAPQPHCSIGADPGLAALCDVSCPPVLKAPECSLHP